MVARSHLGVVKPHIKKVFYPKLGKAYWIVFEQASNNRISFLQWVKACDYVSYLNRHGE